MSFDKIVSERNTTVLAGIVFLAFLVYRISLIFFQFPDVGGVEGNVVYFIQRLLDGQALYADPETAPYAIAQYSPFYYYIIAAIARLAGIHADDILSVFITGRIISLVFNLGLVFVVYRIAKDIFNISSRRSLIASFLAFIFLEITSFARPDSFYHFFFMLSIYFFLQPQKEQSSGKRKQNTGIIFSAIVAAMALFSKQSGIVLPALIGIWMLWQKKYKTGFLFFCYYIITVFIFIVIIHYSHGFDLFYKNVVQGVDNGISPGWFRTVIISDFYLKFGLIIVPLFVMAVFVLKNEKENILRCSLFLIIGQFVLANILAIKNGSNPGYFTEWWTLLFILCLYYRKQYLPSTQIISKIFISMICLALILKGIFIAGPLKEKINALADKNSYTIYKRDQVIADKINGQLEKGDKYTVFLNFNTAESYLSNMLFRHAVMPQMDIVALAAYPRKKYNYSLFDEEILRGSYKWMIMKNTGPQKQFFNLMLDKYQLQETISGFNIYQYKP